MKATKQQFERAIASTSDAEAERLWQTTVNERKILLQQQSQVERKAEQKCQQRDSRLLEKFRFQNQQVDAEWEKGMKIIQEREQYREKCRKEADKTHTQVQQEREARKLEHSAKIQAKQHDRILTRQQKLMADNEAYESQLKRREEHQREARLARSNHTLESHLEERRDVRQSSQAFWFREVQKWKDKTPGLLHHTVLNQKPKPDPLTPRHALQAAVEEQREEQRQVEHGDRPRSVQKGKLVTKTSSSSNLKRRPSSCSTAARTTASTLDPAMLRNPSSAQFIADLSQSYKSISVAKEEEKKKKEAASNYQSLWREEETDNTQTLIDSIPVKVLPFEERFSRLGRHDEKRASSVVEARKEVSEIQAARGFNQRVHSLDVEDRRWAQRAATQRKKESQLSNIWSLQETSGHRREVQKSVDGRRWEGVDATRGAIKTRAMVQREEVQRRRVDERTTKMQRFAARIAKKTLM